jgi:hypothetical protein
MLALDELLCSSYTVELVRACQLIVAYTIFSKFQRDLRVSIVVIVGTLQIPDLRSGLRK